MYQEQEEYQTIMYQDQEYRSPLWGSSPSQFEQDFWEGANSPTSTDPSNSPPNVLLDHTFQDVPSSADVSVKMDYTDMEAFGNVILPERPEFGPDDLFSDLLDIPSIKNERICIQSKNSSKITIKVKKVRQPKPTSSYKVAVNKKAVDVSPSSVESYSTAFDGYSWNLLPTNDNVLVDCFEQHDDFSSLLELASNVQESRLDEQLPISQAPNLALIDAFSLASQDGLLDDVLFQSSPPPTVPEILIGASSPPNSRISDSSISDFLSVGGNSSPTSSTYSGFDCLSEVSTTPASCSPESSTIEYQSWPQTDTVDMEELAPSVEYNVFSEVCEPPRKREKLSKESKYLRKKQQNKEAAIRYRQKKKTEESDVLQMLDTEENTNTQLKKEFKGLKQELSIMRRLMREAFTGKV